VWNLLYLGLIVEDRADFVGNNLRPQETSRSAMKQTPEKIFIDGLDMKEGFSDGVS